MSYAYANFESITPGGTVQMLAAHANELRAAIVERAVLIGMSEWDLTDLPAVVTPGDQVEYSWLTGMRSAIETIITQETYAKYGILVGNTWSSNLTDFLSEIHGRFSDCGSGEQWITVNQHDEPMAAHIRELYYMCEALSFVDWSNTWSMPAGTYPYTRVNVGSWSYGTSPLHSTEHIVTGHHPDPPYDYYQERAYSNDFDVGVDCAEIFIATGRYDDLYGEPLNMWYGIDWDDYGANQPRFISYYYKSGWHGFDAEGGSTLQFSFGPIGTDGPYDGLGSILDYAQTWFGIYPQCIIHPLFVRDNKLFDLGYNP